MEVYEAGSGLISGVNPFSTPFNGQMQQMQQLQFTQNQQLANLNQQIGNLTNAISDKAVGTVTQPFIDDFGRLKSSTVGAGSALWNFYMSNPNVYSVEQQRNMALQVGGSASQWINSGLKWGSDIASFVGALGGFSALGIPGMAMSMALLPLAGTYFSHTGKMMKQNIDYTSFFSQQSYMFTDPRKMQNPFSYGLGLKQAQEFSREMVSANQELFMPSEEFSEVVKGLVSSGLMVGAGSDLKNFKKKMLDSIQFVRSAAKILDETHEEVIEMMSDFKKLGISTSNFDIESARIKGVASFVGMPVNQLVGMLEEIVAMQTQGTTKSPTVALHLGEDLSALFGDISKRASDELREFINQSGGAVGAASIVGNMLGSTFEGPWGSILGGVFTPDGGGRFTFDSSAYEILQRQQLSIEELGNLGKDKINNWSQAEQFMFWQKKGSLLSNLEPEHQLGLFSAILESAKRSPSFQGLEDDSIIMALTGASEAEAKLMGLTMEEFAKGDFKKEKDSRNITALVMAAESGRRLLTPTTLSKIKYGWEEFMDKIGAPAISGQNAIVNFLDRHMNEFTTLKDVDTFNYAPMGVEPYDFSTKGMTMYSMDFNRRVVELEHKMEPIITNVFGSESGLPSLGDDKFRLLRLGEGIKDFSDIFKTIAYSHTTETTGSGEILPWIKDQFGERLKQITPYAQSASEATGVSVSHILAMALTESGANINTRDSYAGAIGPMQLMPGTAAGLGVNPRDTAQNVLGGATYLRNALLRYGGNLGLTAISYNAGVGRADWLASKITNRPFSDLTKEELAEMDVGPHLELLRELLYGDTEQTKQHYKNFMSYFEGVGGTKSEEVITRKQTETSIRALESKLDIVKYLRGVGEDVSAVDTDLLRDILSTKGGTIKTETKQGGTVTVRVEFSNELIKFGDNLLESVKTAADNVGVSGESADKLVLGIDELKKYLAENIYKKDVNQITGEDLASLDKIMKDIEGAIKSADLDESDFKKLLGNLLPVETFVGDIRIKAINAVGERGIVQGVVAPKYKELSIDQLLTKYSEKKQFLEDVKITSGSTAYDEAKGELNVIVQSIGAKQREMAADERQLVSESSTLLAKDDSKTALERALKNLQFEQEDLSKRYMMSGPTDSGEVDSSYHLDQTLYRNINVNLEKQRVVRELIKGNVGSLSGSEVRLVYPDLRGLPDEISKAVNDILYAKETTEKVDQDVSSTLQLVSADEKDMAKIKSALAGSKALGKARFDDLKQKAEKGLLADDPEAMGLLYDLKNSTDAYGQAQAEYLLGQNKAVVMGTEFTNKGAILSALEKGHEREVLADSLSSTSFTVGSIKISSTAGLTPMEKMNRLSKLGSEAYDTRTKELGKVMALVAEDVVTSEENVKQFTKLLKGGDTKELSDFILRNPEFSRAVEASDTLKEGIEVVMQLSSLLKLIYEEQDVFIKGRDQLKTFGQSITEGIDMLIGTTGSLNKLEPDNLKAWTKFMQSIGEFIGSADYLESGDPAEGEAKLRQKIVSLFSNPENNIKLTVDMVEGLLKNLKDLNLDDVDMRSLESLGNEILDSIKTGVTGSLGEQTADLLVEVTKIMNSRKQDLEDNARQIETSYQNITDSLENHRRALNAVHTYIGREIDDMRNKFPIIIPTTTYPRGPAPIWLPNEV